MLCKYYILAIELFPNITTTTLNVNSTLLVSHNRATHPRRNIVPVSAKPHSAIKCGMIMEVFMWRLYNDGLVADKSSPQNHNVTDTVRPRQMRMIAHQRNFHTTRIPSSIYSQCKQYNTAGFITIIISRYIYVYAVA